MPIGDGTAPEARMSAERESEIRSNVYASDAYRVPNTVVRELLRELDAVRAERDECRSSVQLIADKMDSLINGGQG